MIPMAETPENTKKSKYLSGIDAALDVTGGKYENIFHGYHVLHVRFFYGRTILNLCNISIRMYVSDSQ